MLQLQQGEAPNVAPEIQLSDFATTPLYNIKAVVQATNISPSTLRAWERRYHMCQPQRSDSGYRLYSDRDIAIIRWLKAQVDAGMSISHAVAWLQNLLDSGDNGQAALLPTPSARTQDAAPPTLSQLDVQNFSSLHKKLLEALLLYREHEAEQVLSDAFSLYAMEQVGEHVIVPTMIEIGERWHRQEISVTREHYASNYLLQRLAAILRVVPNGYGGPLVWVGCAPGERHEMGVLLLCIYLRRAGFQVRYLGQDLPADDLLQEAVLQKPALVLLSAASADSAARLRQVCERLVAIEPPRPIVGYGGRVFNLNPELRDSMTGVFLGASAAEAVEAVLELLAERSKRNGR
jgi:DNA-binding transcriptional MerR regulator/methylmalonyl-CoA mutase cobalamin-binding subunit